MKDYQIHHEDLLENFDVSEFIFTSKTITYSGKTIQLSNVTRIWLFNYNTIIKAKFNIRQKGFLFSIFLIILGSSIIWLRDSGYIHDPIYFRFGIFGILIGLSILVYGIIERRIKGDENLRHFGIVIETASSAEKLVSMDKEFINNLFRYITIAMNKESQQAIVANFNSKEINVIQDNRKIQNGDIFENITNSSINNRSNVK